MKLDVKNYEIDTLPDPVTNEEKYFYRIEYVLGENDKKEISTLFNTVTDCIGALGVRLKDLVMAHLADLGAREWLVRTFVIAEPSGVEHDINTWELDDMDFEEALDKAEELVAKDVMNLGAKWVIDAR